MEIFKYHPCLHLVHDSKLSALQIRQPLMQGAQPEEVRVKPGEHKKQDIVWLPPEIDSYC